VDALDTTLLGSGIRSLPAYHPISPIQARRFVGRATELWDLHAKLTANQRSIITGVYGQAGTQVLASAAMANRCSHANTASGLVPLTPEVCSG
jgi:hypothetical protein